jgi:hypothetical protein
MAEIQRRSVRHALGPQAQDPICVVATVAVEPSLPKTNRASAIAPAAK